MPASVGRNLKVYHDTTVDVLLAGVQEKSISINGEAIDISGDDSSGYRELMAEPGQKSVDVSVSGISKDDKLRVIAFANDRTLPLKILYPDGGTITGTFYLATYKETGPYKDAMTFEAEWQSTGAVTFTAAV